MRERIQNFGSFLASMVTPNIAAFIAWGLITSLFIEPGWFPIPELGGFGTNAEGDPYVGLVGPMITYLLPLLIGYTGGKIVYDHRGGVVGAAATMGAIIGAGIPMFIGGMIMGPLGGYLIKKVDEWLEDKTPNGFELLFNNFSAGFLIIGLSLTAFYLVGPAVRELSEGAEVAVDFLVAYRLLPLAALLIEPAKVLFLNNALNHGVLAPLGVAEVSQSGRAIHFLLETNPGPGLGLLLAYWVAGKGMLKQSAPGAAIIHFFGGIHEIYFPYVLAKPIMIAAVISGGLVANLWFVIFGAGLIATPAPGSIFAYLAVMPRGQWFPVLGGVVVGAVTSFIVGSALLRLTPVGAEDQETDTSLDSGQQTAPVGAIPSA